MDLRAARIIDANINRLTEGLRVVEDVVRLGMAQPGLLRSVRTLRTRLGAELRPLRAAVIPGRASETDPGRRDRFDRTGRRNLDDVLLANLKRSQEACRVLEEVLKISAPEPAARFKAARFRLYSIEKRALAALETGRTAENRS